LRNTNCECIYSRNREIEKRGGEMGMRKNLFIFTLIVLLGLVVALQEAFAFRAFTGRVAGIDLRHLIVKRHDGYVATFRIGWRTRYYPNRRPLIGERVRVEYLYRRGENVGYTVTMLASVRRHPDPAPVPVPGSTLRGEVTVVKSRVNIRTGPGRGYPIATMVDKGQVLTLKGQTGSWYQVLVPHQQITGWIHSSLVRVEKLERVPQGTKKI
jgi:uncharacterized protein YgiM (DUF1202 family)